MVTFSNTDILLFDIRNKDDNRVPVDIQDWVLDRYFDRPSTLNMVIDDRNAVSRDATIDLTYKNNIIFRGFLDLPDHPGDGTDILKFKDRVSLLELRYAQDYTYLGGTLVSEILTDAEPGAIGVLYQANSLIPQGSFEKHQFEKYQKKGFGPTKLTIIDIKEDGVSLTHATYIYTMTAGSWVQEGAYLYVWCTDGLAPKTHVMTYARSTTPTVYNNLPGLLYAAGTIGTFRLPGGGTSGQLGTITKIFSGIVQLTLGSGSMTLNWDQYYQDATYLYVKLQDPAHPAQVIDPNTIHISVPNFKDTLIRMGSNMDLAEYTFEEDFEVTRRTILSCLKDLMSHVDGEYAFEHSPDGYTYLDTSNEISRGSMTAPVRQWPEHALKDLNITYGPDFMANMLLATGDPDTFAAYGSFAARKIWRESEENKINHDAEALFASLQTQYNLRQSAINVSFKAEEDFFLEIGDWCRINRLKDAPIVTRIKHIQLSQKNDMVIEMGQREKSLGDYWTLVKQIQEEERYRKMKNPYGEKWARNP
jgi:hypothetical protein